MEIKTLRFGTMPVQEDKIITFPKGIMGFARNKRYVLFPHSEGSPFFWLQSLEDGDLAFVVTNPRIVNSDYAVDIEEGVLLELDAEQPSDLEVMCIVTVPRNQPERMTINLLGPIIINARNRKAAQIICDRQSYSHCHPVIPEKPV